MRNFFLLPLLLLCISIYGQTSPDGDKDGIPDSEDVCPGLAGIKANQGCPVEKKAFSESDKKLLVKNFLLILADVKTGFKTIKSGETDWDVVTRQGQSQSGIHLFPNYTDSQAKTLLFAQYNGKPLNAYQELSPIDVNSIITILLPTLKAKGFIEVNTKGMNEGMEGRSFRSKDAVVQIASHKNNSKTTVNIGKFSYYYEKDVVAINTKPPVKRSQTVNKPQVSKSQPNIISLADAIRIANNDLKKSPQNVFTSFKTSNPISNFVFTGNEAMFSIKGMYQTMVSVEADEIRIQYKQEADETVAKLYADPCASLSLDLGGNYNEVVKDKNSLIASWGDVTITKALMSGRDNKYATFIFIRPKNLKEESKPSKDLLTQDELKRQFGPGMDKILSESENGFSKSKGAYRFKGADEYDYYESGLPKLGFRFGTVAVGKQNGKPVAKYIVSTRISGADKAKQFYDNYNSLLNTYLGSTGGENTKDREFSIEQNGHAKFIKIAMEEGPLWEVLIEIWDVDAIFGSDKITLPDNNKQSTATFIEKNVFEDILETVCENTFQHKIKGKKVTEYKQWYETNFKTSNPLYYQQLTSRSFEIKTVLSANINDLDAAATYINKHMAETNACWEAYRVFKLKRDGETKVFSDVNVWSDGGMFMYIEQTNGQIQLRITKINYDNTEKEKPSASGTGNTVCGDFEKIVNECLTGFNQVKGSFVKKETPALYYTTTLPNLGFDEKFVVESKNINIDNGAIGKAKDVVYYSAEKKYDNSADALRLFDKTTSVVKNCFSGAVNITDDKNQKMYELITSYKGKTIRILILYLNFFQSSVTVSIKLTD